SCAVNSFLLVYGLMYAVGGWLIDILKTWCGVVLSLGIWSFASALHTLVVGVWDFCLYRFLLGAAEPGSFIGSIKGIASWFPSRERGVAIGLVFAGTGVGAIFAPPAVVWLALHFGWRMAFLMPSIAGALWLPLWLWIYHEPEEHPLISKEERELILNN